MEPYEIMDGIRAQLTDTNIVDELVQYMTTDELKEFADHLIRMFDLDYIGESRKAPRARKLNEGVQNMLQKYTEIFDEFDDDLVCIEDLNIRTRAGQLITHIGLTENGNIVFFNGNPDEDLDDEWEEVLPANNAEKLNILDEIYDNIM